MNQVESSSSRQTKKIQIWCRHWMKNETFWRPKVNDFSSGWSAGKNAFCFKKSKAMRLFFEYPKRNSIYEYAAHFWFVKIWGSGLVDCLWFVYFEEKKHHSEGFILWDGWNTNKNHRTRLNGNLWKSYEISTWLRQLQSFIGSILVVFLGAC